MIMHTAAIAIEIQEAAENASRRVRDPAVMRKACDDMDRIRNDVKRRLGNVEAAVDLVARVDVALGIEVGHGHGALAGVNVLDDLRGVGGAGAGGAKGQRHVLVANHGVALAGGQLRQQ